MKRLILALLLPVLLSASVYNPGNPKGCAFGQSVVVWSAETPTPGNGTTAASQQVTLQVASNGGTPFSVDAKFSGNPAAFEVDVQCAAVDSDTNYQTIANGNITTVDSTNNTFHVDAALTVCRYTRLLMRTRTNAVSITATVSQ